MSRFSGPFPGRKDPRTRNKGIERQYHTEKRLEAEARDEELPEDDPRRRAIRLNTMPEPDLKTVRRRNRRRNQNVEVHTVDCQLELGSDGCVGHE